MILIIISIILLLAIIGLAIWKKPEQFAGALTQLYAKGPQDNYLTVG